jgi:hypothetical protein
VTKRPLIPYAGAEPPRRPRALVADNREATLERMLLDNLASVSRSIAKLEDERDKLTDQLAAIRGEK